MQNEKNNSLPTQGGGAGDRETVDLLAKAMCDGKWDAADLNETANGESPEEQRDYWRDKARIALSALQAAPAAGDRETVLASMIDLGKLAEYEGRGAADLGLGEVERLLQIARSQARRGDFYKEEVSRRDALQAAPSEGGEPWGYAVRQHEQAPWSLWTEGKPRLEAWSDVFALYARPPAPSEGGEPVAWRYQILGRWCVTDSAQKANMERSLGTEVDPLYARPPAPSEPVADDEPMGAEEYEAHLSGLDDYLWNQARAADGVEARCIYEAWRDALTLLRSRPPAPSEEPLVGELTAEVERLRKALNTPEVEDFANGVVSEAQHQRHRWGAEHDAGKAPLDWFWLVGFLAQKAAMSQIAGDTAKALHHTVSTAAALANWHASITGLHPAMRPGIATPHGEEPAAPAPDAIRGGEGALQAASRPSVPSSGKSNTEANHGAGE